MMAAFAKANGVDFASRGSEALRRGAERTVQGADNPQIFQAQTGSQQVLNDFDGDGQRSKLAWLEPYCWTVGCDGAMARKLSSLRPATGPSRSPRRSKIGREPVCTPVTNAHLVCRLRLEKTKHNYQN